MDLKLRGANVLITGASRGLGKDFALGFAREGANVAICARNVEPLEAVADEVRAHGVTCVPLTVDLFQGDDCRRVVEEAASALGGLNVLVNNASTNVDRLSGPSGVDDSLLMERFLGKTMAAVRCSYAAVSHMRRASGGRIVCIGGTAARAVQRGLEGATSASSLPQGLGNSALANFVKYLSEEVASDGILVNIVHPHITRTERHEQRVKARSAEMGVSLTEADASMESFVPIGRLVMPEDITPLVLLLSSPLTSATTGQAIAIDGGALRGVCY